jgi:ribonucleoside-diphosphate reductase beta chain
MQTIFDPAGKLHTVNMFGERAAGVVNLNKPRYAWAVKVYEQMLDVFWIPDKVNLSTDKASYRELDPKLKFAWKNTISYLNFLDSLQINNLGNIAAEISSPEIKMILVFQQQQETVHAKSYEYLLETIVTGQEKQQVYDLWRDNPDLYERCVAIAGFYNQYVEKPIPSNFIKSLMANYLLEGIYFKMGFNLFYALSKSGQMLGCADMIRYIERDENIHVFMFQNLLKEAFRYYDYAEDELLEMMMLAVKYEIIWFEKILGNGIPFLDLDSVKTYLGYLGNVRLKAIGLPAIFPQVTKNPLAHLDSAADTKQPGKYVKGNFFESTVTAYNSANSVKGWNF